MAFAAPEFPGARTLLANKVDSAADSRSVRGADKSLWGPLRWRCALLSGSPPRGVV